jgi:hypothetical protein
MPRLIDRVPIPETPSEVVVRGERVRLRADQIIVWLVITPKLDDPPRPTSTPFPAILDTGHTHSLSLQERHLVDWAGVRPEGLRRFGAVRDRDRGHRLELLMATIWVYRNQPSSRERLSDRPPIPLGGTKGIAVYPPGVEFPRLPILGLRAIADNDLILTVNGPRREATLRTAFAWWPFAGR